MEELPLSHRRLTIELSTEQINWMKSLPYGMRKPVMQAVVGDLMEACGNSDRSKYDLLAAIVARRLVMKAEGDRLVLHNVTQENGTQA